MNSIKVHTQPFHYLEIINLWDEVEKKEMLDEMLHLEKKGIFKNPEDTGAAVNEDGVVLKKNKAIYIDEVWTDRSFSNILKHNRKIFDVLDNSLIKESWFFDGLYTNLDTTMVSYYEDSDYYKPHRDKVKATAVSWFFKEPQKFTGGSLTFTDYNLTFEVSNDLVIIFPSNIKHEVSKISINPEHKGKQNGRFCMSQFLNATCL